MNCYALHAINMSKLKQQDAIYLFVIEVRLLWEQRSLKLRESSGILVLVYNKNCPLSACLPVSFYASLCPRHLFLNFRKKWGACYKSNDLAKSALVIWCTSQLLHLQLCVSLCMKHSTVLQEYFSCYDFYWIGQSTHGRILFYYH